MQFYGPLSTIYKLLSEFMYTSSVFFSDILWSIYEVFEEECFIQDPHLYYEI